MRLMPNINPVLTFRTIKIDPGIFNYPKWSMNLPEVITEDIFNMAWETLYGFNFNECEVEYGDCQLFNIALKGSLTVITPTTAHIRPIVDHTEEPVLAEDQTFYYCGAGCSWSTDLLGQRFYLIDPATMLPNDWNEVYAWEVVKRYKPFMGKITIS